MMHSTCIAAFRSQNRRRHGSQHAASGRPGQGHGPRLTAIVEREVHRCVQRRASESDLPAFYTLCGYLVAPGNAAETCLPVSCPRCLALTSGPRPH